MWPHRWQPIRLYCPWDSPGKNTGAGCISFSNAWKWKVKVKLLSRSRLLATPWTGAYQAPPPMGLSGQEYWSGVPLPSLSVDTTFCLFHRMWKDTQIASTSCLLWIMLLWTWVCKYPFEILLSITLDMYSEVGFLDHIVILTFLNNCHSVFYSSYIILQSHQWLLNVPVSHQYLIFSGFLDNNHHSRCEMQLFWT